MMPETNYIQDTAQRLAEWMNEKIATVIVDEINSMIWLDQIIADDLANRKKEFEEAKKSVKDKDIELAMQEPTIEFPTITSKLEYAFKALLHKGYTFTHDVDHTWRVYIKFFEIKKEVVYVLDTKYTINISEEVSESKVDNI